VQGGVHSVFDDTGDCDIGPVRLPTWRSSGTASLGMFVLFGVGVGVGLGVCLYLPLHTKDSQNSSALLLKHILFVFVGLGLDVCPINVISYAMLII